MIRCVGINICAFHYDFSSLYVDLVSILNWQQRSRMLKRFTIGDGKLFYRLSLRIIVMILRLSRPSGSIMNRQDRENFVDYEAYIQCY